MPNAISNASPPTATCKLCPRLYEFRVSNKTTYPDWHNAPVGSFGDINSRLLIVGLAPGLRGANRTSRPFTGDWAGDLLFSTLSKFNFSRGIYKARHDDGFKLIDCRITNAVRCVPPENKPTGQEIKTCNAFLQKEINGMPNLTVIIALGSIAHNAVLLALDCRKSCFKFKHGSRFVLQDNLTIFNSYHCSRYNTNTRRLTPKMFESVFEQVRLTLFSGQK